MFGFTRNLEVLQVLGSPIAMYNYVLFHEAVVRRGTKTQTTKLNAKARPTTTNPHVALDKQNIRSVRPADEYLFRDVVFASHCMHKRQQKVP